MRLLDQLHEEAVESVKLTRPQSAIFLLCVSELDSGAGRANVLLMCGRYRLTKRRLLEIEECYGVEDIRDLYLWEREFNIPPGEMAPIIFEHKGKRHLVQALWGLRSSWTESAEEASRVSTFNAKA